jgi:hypothetical protein
MTRSIVPIAIAAMLASVATLGLATLTAFPSSTASADGEETAPLVRAQRFELVDGNGAVRAMLGVNPAGLPTFALLDEAGQQRFVIAGNPFGGYGMSIRGDDGAVRFAVAHGASDGEAFAGLNIRDAAGTIRANLFATDDGGLAGFNVFDADQRIRARLGYFPDQKEAPALRFLDGEGGAIWQTP